jgi:protein SCO1/2
VSPRAVLASCALLSTIGVPAAAAAIDYDAALAASQRAIGRPIGNAALVDTEHRSVTLADYRGRPLVVQFAYTGCTQVCSTTTRVLDGAVRAARETFGAERFDVVTIGFNPPFDGPDAMAAFARQNGIRDARWRFLSADAKTIAAVTRDFGFTYAATAKGMDHISQITVVDAQGVVYRQVYGDTFETRMLLAPLKELLTGQAQAAGARGVWDRVKLVCTVYDPNTGGYRVSYSLFIEIFAGATILAGIAGFLVMERRRSRA